MGRMKMPFGLRDVAGVMNSLPEVTWDRCVPRMSGGSAFGWIAREDGRSDFLVLYWDERGPCGYVTSSAKHSADFSRRLFGEEAAGNHKDCERVEKVFAGMVTNKVVLPAAAEVA